MLTCIPTERPATPLLDQIDHPSDLKRLPIEQLERLCAEMRLFLLYTVGQTGGHLGAGLGVVELTVALHYLFDTPHDPLIWDVGHQAYPHKILTGRREAMKTLRQMNGISPFPCRSESPFDAFGTGHASTSISAAVGMALASRHQKHQPNVVAIIGDGAMTAGQAFEALNHATEAQANVVIVFNDNEMSISHNVGGLSKYFSDFFRKRQPTINDADQPTPRSLYESLGIDYSGPIDGHNLPLLVETLSEMKGRSGPQLLHLKTVKGKGYAPAEKQPIRYHALDKITAVNATTAPGPKYSEVFGAWIVDQARHDANLHAITPAMSLGSGLTQFAEKFPERFHDVGIAEQHAITFAAGLACNGVKPVVAIYSTFLQRGYDQLIHDVALQKLDVTLAIDRAGLVGADGPTHWGAYDIAYTRCIPNLVIATPSNEDECYRLLQACYDHTGPALVRYPRGTGPKVSVQTNASTPLIGKAKPLRSGNTVAILNFGPYCAQAGIVADTGNYTLIDMRFVKPMDTELLEQVANTHDLLVTIEDGSIMGGAGSAVLEWLSSEGMPKPVLTVGIPDTFIEHCSQTEQRQQCGLDTDGLLLRINTYLAKIKHP